jgi:hypothetical protein
MFTFCVAFPNTNSSGFFKRRFGILVLNLRTYSTIHRVSCTEHTLHVNFREEFSLETCCFVFYLEVFLVKLLINKIKVYQEFKSRKL